MVVDNCFDAIHAYVNDEFSAGVKTDTYNVPRALPS